MIGAILIIGVLILVGLINVMSGMARKVVMNRATGEMMYVGANEDLYLGANQNTGYYEGQVSGQQPSRAYASPSAPLNKPVTIIPEGGGVRATPLKPILHRRRVRPTEFDELGTRAYLDQTNNGNSTTGLATLTANTANAWSTIFTYTIPNNRDLHFKPQNWQARDVNCPSFMLVLTSDETGTLEIYGRYQIRVENSNNTGTKAILASGNLAEFFIQGNITANLNDANMKVYYTEDYEGSEGDVIEVRLNSPTVLDTSGSRLWLGHYVYVP